MIVCVYSSLRAIYSDPIFAKGSVDPVRTAQRPRPFSEICPFMSTPGVDRGSGALYQSQLSFPWGQSAEKILGPQLVLWYPELTEYTQVSSGLVTPLFTSRNTCLMGTRLPRTSCVSQHLHVPSHTSMFLPDFRCFSIFLIFMQTCLHKNMKNGDVMCWCRGGCAVPSLLNNIHL